MIILCDFILYFIYLQTFSFISSSFTTEHSLCSSEVHSQFSFLMRIVLKYVRKLKLRCNAKTGDLGVFSLNNSSYLSVQWCNKRKEKKQKNKEMDASFRYFVHLYLFQGFFPDTLKSLCLSEWLYTQVFRLC